jgi:hypothetical protein
MSHAATFSANTQASTLTDCFPNCEESAEEIYAGVVNAVESIASGSYSVISIRCGFNRDLRFLIKGCASSIIGRVACIAPIDNILIAVLDGKEYLFKVIRCFDTGSTIVHPQSQLVCFECNAKLSPKNFLKHLRRVHYFPTRII